MNLQRSQISVVIPAYNVEDYIGAALDSLCAQDMAPFEVIVVNDGSTDSTFEKIVQYKQWLNLQIISTDNRGQGPARNKGFQNATGEYVYFFDADDLMDRKLISAVQSIIIARSNPELVLFSGKCLLESGVASDKFELYKRGFELDNVTGAEALARMIHVGSEPEPLTGMYVTSTRFWRQRKLYFKSIFHEDVELFPSLLLAANRVVVSNKVLFHRRIRPNSTTTSPKGRKYMQSYLVVALSDYDLYKDSKQLHLSVKRYLRRRALRHANWYIKLGTKLSEPIAHRTLMIFAYKMRSMRTILRMLRHYLLVTARTVRVLVSY